MSQVPYVGIHISAVAASVVLSVVRGISHNFSLFWYHGLRNVLHVYV